jgi:hypothetical protein
VKPPAALQPAPPSLPPTVHEATLASGPSGAVEWGPELTDEETVHRRKKALDIVVRGSNAKANRAKARQLEDAVGTPITEHQPHPRTGPMALPHFHQVSRTPDGHSFYEITRRTARRKR